MLQTVQDQNRRQAEIASATTASISRLWRRLGPDFTSQWHTVKPQVLDVLDRGRAATVAAASGYVAGVLAETGQTAAPEGAIVPATFLSTAPDGRSLDTLLDQPPIWTRIAMSEGHNVAGALSRAGNVLSAVMLTVLADTHRAVYQADIMQRPRLGGYTRQIQPGACKDCILLAGKWFRWNQGFQRHIRCRCIHIPAAENIAGDVSTDPYAYFQSLPAAEQERVFGRIEARAIRDGADIYRVVNINNRGLGTAKGALRYGTPSRMTVDDIYRVAGTRTNAIRLLEREGYITGPQVVGGNVIGIREGFGQLGRGGTRVAASSAARTAQETGVRDPLNRYTMTAAERRLYDANYRLEYARRTGSVPRSIGQSSADIYANRIPATPERLAELERELQVQISVLRGDPDRGIPPAPPSVQYLAELLGIH